MQNVLLVIKGEFLKHGASLRRQSYYRPLIGNRRQAIWNATSFDDLD